MPTSARPSTSANITPAGRPPLFQPKRLGRYVGELNTTWYEPRGVAAVISPWNFPLAICTGMTTAALVTGNTVIVKPSGQTVGIARVMCDILWQAGVPADVLQFLAGPGSVVGDGAGPRSARGPDRLHRLEGGRARHPPGGRSGARWPALPEESGLRDGRQERHHHRRIGRPGRGGAGGAAVGLRLLRPEMLGVQPRDRGRRGL